MTRSLTALALVLSMAACAQTPPVETTAAPMSVDEAMKGTTAREQQAMRATTREQQALQSHIAMLSSDEMQGREAGTPAYDRAAQYVADQMKSLGVQPAGDAGSYLQRVPLVSYRSTDRGTMRAGSTPLAFGTDYFPSANPTRTDLAIEGDVVFVGYGVSAPGEGRDDYAGADVRGKIVAVMAGGPASMASEMRAHYGNGGTKALEAAKRGAIGIVTLESPTFAKMRPFASGMDSWDHARMTWAKADGTPHITAPSVTGLGSLSMAGAEKLFAGSGGTYAAASAAAEAGQTKPIALTQRLSATGKTEIRQIASSNVAGLIPGGDPALSKEVVVISAHLDHVGIGKAVDGDTIYNGAMDNSVGIASMLEVARRFRDSGEKPRRSIMLLAVTAEEKGLVGADYFARNPTVPKANLVANVNLDMPIITYPFEDVVAFGADRSNLGGLVRAAAEKMGVAYSPDPMPEQGFFTRSDHYRFVQQGIPAVFLWPGVKGPGKAAFDDFLKNHYHKPSDEIGLINWQSGVRFVEANYGIAREIANADARPAWNKGDFFGVLYNGYGAK